MTLLGPMFWHELTSVSRRQRLTFARTIFAALVFAAICLLYADFFGRQQFIPGKTISRANAGELARFAMTVFMSFVGLQLAAVILLTPGLTASALAEERSHNTLPFLLTTHLTSREIVLGKLWPRLLQVGMIVLTGLPIIGFLQLFGGVNPILIASAFAAAGVTALSLGSIGICTAVFVKKPQRAVWRAYLWVAIFAVVSTFLVWRLDLAGGWSTLLDQFGEYVDPSGFSWRYRIWFAARITRRLSLTTEAAHWFCVANPFYAIRLLVADYRGNVPLEDAVPAVLAAYSLIHGAVAVICLSIAIVYLRRTAAQQVMTLTPSKSVYLKPAPHPPIEDRPVLWKERYCEIKPRQRWLAMLFSKWFFYVSFLPMWALIVWSISETSTSFGYWLSIALKFGGTLVACGLLLRVGMQAARSICGERDRQTLDSLLSTPLPRSEFFRDKWLGSLMNGRWVLLWLMVHWALGLLSMVLGFTAAPLLVMEMLVFGAFMVSVGLYFSVRCDTSKQAIARTLMVAIFGTFVFPWFVCKVVETMVDGRQQVTYYGEPHDLHIGQQLGIGLSPARVLYATVEPQELFPVWDWSRQNEFTRWFFRTVPTIVASLLLYSLLGWGFWVAARARFRLRFGLISQGREGPKAAESAASTRIPQTGSELP